jgi:hypothetical protein
VNVLSPADRVDRVQWIHGLNEKREGLLEVLGVGVGGVGGGVGWAGVGRALKVFVGMFCGRGAA